MTVNKYILLVLGILLCVAVGFITGLYVKKSEVKIITNEVPVYIKGDTVFVTKKYYSKTIGVVKVPVANSIKHHNEKVFDKDTVIVDTDITFIDSSCKIEQSIELTHTQEFVTDTIKIRVPYETLIYKEIPFYEKPFFNFVAGIILTIVAVLVL